MEKARRKRNRYELLAEMLASSKGGARKTSIMFRANLSFTLLNKYLFFLLNNGFLEKDDGSYSPSERGMSYLRWFAKYQRARAELAKSEERVQLFVLLAPVPRRTR